MVSAIIVAAGEGVRMKGTIRKQYLVLEGIPILARTLMKFNDCSEIEQILLVVPAEDVDFCKANILSLFKHNKPIKLVVGGRERQDSVYHGIVALEKENGVVVVHDGVRPFVTCEKVSMCITAAQQYGAAVLGVPAHDTLKQVDDVGIVKTLERKDVWFAQTPQVFQYRLLREAHEKAKRDAFVGTDDALLVERMGNTVKMIMGDKLNLKITTPDDLALAKAVLHATNGGEK